MMSSTFGAPLGGTIRAGQYGVEPFVVRSIFPPNFCGGAGSCVPSIVMVALGEPGGPLTCCPTTAGGAVATATTASTTREHARRPIDVLLLPVKPILHRHGRGVLPFGATADGGQPHPPRAR